MTHESMPILLVEDNYDDILLIRRAFRKAGIAPPMSIVADGDQAVAYLAREGEYADTERFPVPMLVLLDLKLPRRSGLEVLAWLRQQPELRRMLVVVLTSSEENSDLVHAYDLGANSYLVKPVNFKDFIRLVELIDTYWFKTNQLPQVF